jgi:hypothetical protein
VARLVDPAAEADAAGRARGSGDQQLGPTGPAHRLEIGSMPMRSASSNSSSWRRNISAYGYSRGVAVESSE